ncbi:hypothetical protein PMAYCL1PPCAC_06261, partial [Pristionchus mayeri]
MSSIKWDLVLPADEDQRIEADDGTTFFRTKTSLYSFINGNKSEVVLPVEYLLEPRGSIGNALYFYAKSHVFFKASISSGELKLDRVNEFSLSEGLDILGEQPYYSVRKDSQLTVYRFEENYKVDKGISFDVSGADPDVTSYRLLWRGKLILTQGGESAEISKLNENVLLLRMPFHIMGVYVNDECDLLYLLYHAKRFCLFVDPVDIVIHRVDSVYEPPQEDCPDWGFAPTDIVSVRDDVILYTAAPGPSRLRLSTFKPISRLTRCKMILARND